MNGPQHYTAAERLLATTLGIDNRPEAMLLAAEAQVHATLAAAAATIAAAERYLTDGEGRPVGKSLVLEPMGAAWMGVLQ